MKITLCETSFRRLPNLRGGLADIRGGPCPRRPSRGYGPAVDPMYTCIYTCYLNVLYICVYVYIRIYVYTSYTHSPVFAISYNNR